MIKTFGGVSQKVMGAKKMFSMLIQNSLPIDTTIAKCKEFADKNFFQNQLPLLHIR
jgi:hypothetical protein